MLYDIVKEAADKKNCTIQKVEIECKLPNGSIGKWRDANPSWEKVIIVSRYLNIPLYALRDEADKVQKRRENAVHDL